MISEKLKKKIWEKGREVSGYPKDKIRKDACGALIVYDDFNTERLYGWSIDYIYPESRCSVNDIGNINHIDNLRPLHWRNCLKKGNDYPVYQSAIKANNDKNIEHEEVFEISQYVQNKIRKLFNI